MIRYAKQTDNFRCGPVAIANALKWAGINFSYRDNKKRLDKLCKTKHPTGCYLADLTRALRKIGGKHLSGIQRRNLDDYTPTQVLRLINIHLKKSGIVLLNIQRYNTDGSIGGHFFLIVKKDKTFYQVINYEMAKTELLHFKYLRDILRNCAESATSVWLLKRKIKEWT